jgi:hypothetical protein
MLCVAAKTVKMNKNKYILKSINQFKFNLKKSAMRKSFTRLFGLFILFCMISLQVVAQGWTLTSLSPSDGACQVAQERDFVITLNQPVKPVYNGTISLNNYNGTEYVPIQLRAAYETSAGSGVFVAPASSLNPWRVTFSGNKVTVNFGYKLAEYANYYITVNEHAIQNAAATSHFPGLMKGTDPLTGCTTCGTTSANDPGYDWDFTTQDVTAPTWKTLWPADEALNVNPTDRVSKILFTEPVAFAAGANQLGVGNIALYRSTDRSDDSLFVYGGDVVFTNPQSATFSGDTLIITWPADLPSLAKLYVRVKPGLIVDRSCNPFAGFNTNGVGAGIGWNFSTKDARVPVVTLTTSSCLAGLNFLINLDEAGIVIANTRGALNNDNIDNYIELSAGGVPVAFNASITAASTNPTVITVDPAANLSSATEYTVTLKAGLWDSGDNPIPAKTFTYTSDDFTAPTTDRFEWVNPDGTSFNINLRVNNEPAGTITTYYYIVVKQEDIQVGADKVYYKPEKLDTIVAKAGSVPGIYDSTYWWRGTTAQPDKEITIYASGVILAPANTELLEHVTQLPASHGTDWVVIMVGADASTCGASSIVGIPATNNATGYLYLYPSTTDILPPVPSFSAALVNAVKDTTDGCDLKVGQTGSPSGIKRNGPVYITFNEDVEYEDGTAITGAKIATSVTMTDGANVGINASLSYYDAPNKRMVIFPSRPFASGSSLSVTLLGNRVQDAVDSLRFGPNGTELLLETSYAFCVETYLGPIVTLNPCTTETDTIPGHGRADAIVISINQKVYAPAFDGGGELSNDSANVAFVGKYIQVRKHFDMPNSDALRDAGSIIYNSFSSPADAFFLSQVDITFDYPTSGDGDSTVIMITPKVGFEWESETWYSIELEQELHTIDGLRIDPNDFVDDSYFSTCTRDNYWGFFKSEDSRRPVCIFYEDNDFVVNDPGVVEALLDSNFTVDGSSVILVSIDEWVQLGFNGFRGLDPSARIDDANALRRYFALYKVVGDVTTPISFDVKYFELNHALDIATFYIDPYYAAGDDPNFVKGTSYRVCFIDNPNELAEYVPEDALEDDNYNGVLVTCADFACPADPVPYSCLVNATLGGQQLFNSTSTGNPTTSIAVTSATTIDLVLEFDVPVDQPAGGTVEIFSTACGSVASANLNSGTRTVDHKKITFTLNFNDITAPCIWEEEAEYEIIFSGLDLIANTDPTACSYPNNVNPFNNIVTQDGSAPVITAFIPDLIGLTTDPGCLLRKDSTDIIITWDEAIVPQVGKRLEIWRVGTTSNTNIINISATADTSVAGDNIMKIPSSLFAGLLQYNATYYIHIPTGFVKNNAGIANAQITTNDTLRFCVGPDPAPYFVCAGFAPDSLEAYTPNKQPDLVIEFSEAVAPVTGGGLDIQIYPTGATNATQAFLNAPVSLFQPVTGSGGKKWRLSTATLFAAGTGYSSYDEFYWDSCYDVNIAAGAFRETSGAMQTTAALVTNTFVSGLPQSACPWTFCIGDDIPPTVTFWPKNNYTHVATNSHLYAYISELPLIEPATLGGEFTPLNVTNVESYFRLTRAGNPVPFDIEFVGNDIPGGDNQKQRIRLVPRDPNGPDWSLSSSTPSMMAETEYVLSLVNSTFPQLVDANMNPVTEGFVTFTTEDITCPTFDWSPDATITKATGDSIYISTSINEGGVIRWVVVANGADVPAASAVWGSGFNAMGVARGQASTTDIATNPNFDINFAFKFDATQATGYDFDVYMYAMDDEVDLFAADADILKEWPYADPTMGFETEVYRIKDLRPAANWCTVPSERIDVRFCDDDAPLLVKTYPVQSPKITNFPVGDSIMLIFNERIQLNDDDLTGTKIVLRDLNNNIGVPLAYRLYGANQDTLILYPLDTLSIADEADAFQLWTGANPFKDLAQERDYYLEIDRWAISDTAMCSGSLNYFNEWVGKEHLQFRTEDMTGPCLTAWAPVGNCVLPEANITLTFVEKNGIAINPAITGDSAFIYIYRVGEITPHERIPVSFATGPVSGAGNTWTYTFPTSYMYLSNQSYTVRVPAGLFIDLSENNNVWDGYKPSSTSECETTNGFSWTFHVMDYEAPIAGWRTLQDFSYLNIALTDPEYQGLIIPEASLAPGIAGATINNVPTSSLVKVEFNELVYLQDMDATATPKPWYGINHASVKNELAAAITIAETVGGVTTTLTYDSDGYGNTTNIGNWDFHEIGEDYAIIRIYRAEDHWMLPIFNDDPVRKDLGMKSNATYRLKLAGNKFADQISACDGERNIYGGDDPLVIINTRDDVPPTLSIFDSNENAVCGVKCVEPTAPIHLQFSSKVVKTPWAGINYDSSDPDPFGSNDVNWWSTANLPLLPADLMLTSEINGDYLYFYQTNEAGTSVGDTVRLANVVVDANGMDIYLYPVTALTSQAYYKIGFKGGSVKDQKRVPDGNEFIGMSCVFRVRDVIAPSAVSFFPADDAANISPILAKQTGWNGVTFGADSMAIRFSEPIAKGTSTENIIVRRLNGQIFDEISLASTRVQGAVLVLPVKELEEFTHYYVEVPAGFVTDTTSCTKNGNIAIDPEIIYSSSNRFQWDFSTADKTPPTPIVYIPNHTDTVPKNSNLSIIFDENIIVDPACTTAGVYIYHHDAVPGWVGNPAVDFGNIYEFIPFYNGALPNYTLSGTNFYNLLTNDIITVNPVTDFTRVGTYYIRVSGNCIKDAQGNYWEGLGDSSTWRFTVTNDVAPILASTNPTYNHITDPWVYEQLPADQHGFVIADLSMKFVDEVDRDPLLVGRGEGSIKIFEYRYNPATFLVEEKLWKVYDINHADVKFVNDEVTIENVILRDNINRKYGIYEECYYITVDRGAVTNGYPGSNTFWMGIDNAFVWRFQTGNDSTFVPGYDIISWNIVDNGVDAENLTIPEASTLIVEFNEGIEALDAPAGKVQVYNKATNALVEEVVVTQSMTSGVTLTVPLSNLVDETTYYIVIQEGAFGDTSTVSTANWAIDGSNGVWEFRTGDNTPPAPFAKTPEQDDVCVGSGFEFELKYKESAGLTLGAGEIVISAGEVVLATIPTSAITITGETDTIIVTFDVAGLPDTTLITVNMPAGFIFDGDPHSPLPNEELEWTFTTGENTLPYVVEITPELAETADTVLTLTFNEVVFAVAGKTITINEVEYGVEEFETADSITFTMPLANLESEATYSVVIEEGAFIDINNTCLPNENAEATLVFNVADISAPEIIAYDPVTAPDYVGLVFQITFDDNVTPAAGNVVIYNADGTVNETILATEFEGSVDNTVYSYSPANIRFGEYYVLIDEGAFVDNSAALVGQRFAGVSDPTEITISIIDDEFVNCYNAIYPRMRITGGPDLDVPLNPTVVINFCDERIVAGDGLITIADQSQERVLGVNYFEYIVADSMINGNTLSLPVEGLSENTTYSIVINQGAIKDEAGNSFIGITDANLWIFRTGDFTDPIVLMPADTILNDGTGTVGITSNELGKVYFVKDDVAANEAAFIAAIAANKAKTADVVTADAAVVINAQGLEVGTYKAYAFDQSGRMGVAADVVVVTTIPEVTLYTIKQIQGEVASTPLAGQEVRTMGTVTAVASNGFYIQDANAAWSGILVISTESVGVGSSVEVTGKANEVAGVTVINEVTLVKFIAPVISPVAIQVAATAAVDEKYESVLVYVEGRVATGANVTGDWAITNGSSNTYAINNALYGAYTTKQDFNYGVTGIGIAAGTSYKVLATHIRDISTENSVDDIKVAVKVYPNPFDKFITLEVSNDVTITKAVITNIAGQLVKEVVNPNNSISTSDLRSGVYFISLHTADGIAKTERMIKR